MPLPPHWPRRVLQLLQMSLLLRWLMKMLRWWLPVPLLRQVLWPSKALSRAQPTLVQLRAPPLQLRLPPPLRPRQRTQHPPRPTPLASAPLPRY